MFTQEEAELIMEFLYNLVGINIRGCFAEHMPIIEETFSIFTPFPKVKSKF